MPEKKSHREPEKSTKPLSVPAAASRDWPRTHIISHVGRLETAQGSPAYRPYALWPVFARRALRFLRRSRSAGVVVIVLLLGGATYAAVVYLSNTPTYVYARGLKNSGQLIDNLAAYAQQLQSVPYKSTVLDASMQGKDVLGRYDIDLSGTENRSGDGTFSASGEVDGMPLSSNIRTVATTGSAVPDAYVKSKDLNALKPLIGVQGLPTFNQFDNKWILIDHNLMESYLDNLMRIADKNINKDNPQPAPTLTQISDALAKLQTVSKQYLLTTNSSTAVFKNPVFIGTETDGGRRLNHYRVTYNTAHLAAYLQALGKALDSSQLNAWSRQVSQGKSLDQTLNLAAMGNGVQQHTGTGNTADLWIDHDTKIISKVKINNPSATLSSVVITQGYNGGDQYPFAVTYKGKDADGTAHTTTVQVVLNASTHTTTISLDDQAQAHGLHSTQDVRVNLTPSNAAVQTAGAPAGAVPLLTALGPSGLSDLAQP
ncbi:MAG TPA: hypothetical protein VGM08_02065 [Candidatus Saccharimonadales bacterium]